MRFESKRVWWGGVEGGKPVIERVTGKIDPADVVEGVVEEINQKPFGASVQPGEEIMLPRPNKLVGERPPALTSGASSKDQTLNKTV